METEARCHGKPATRWSPNGNPQRVPELKAVGCSASRIAWAPIDCITNALWGINVRQSQYALSDHRRTHRRDRRARLQSLPGEEGAGRPADQCRAQRPEGAEQVRAWA